MPPDEETDGIVGTDDDRVICIGKGGPRAMEGTLQMAMSLAKFARVIRSSDRKLSDKCIVAVEKVVPRIYQTFDNPREYPRATFHWNLLHIPHILILDVSLDHILNDGPYREDAKKRAAAVLQAMKNKTYFDDLNNWSLFYYHNTFMYAFALIEYANEYPDDKLIPEIKLEIRRFMDEAIVPLTSISPYGQMLELKEEHPRNFVLFGFQFRANQGMTSHYSKIAAISVMASKLLNEPRYLAIAERQIHWLIGKNPRGVSMMSGMGHRQAAVFTSMFSIPGISRWCLLQRDSRCVQT